MTKILNGFFSGSPSHPSMMSGPMTVRGPNQGPRGTGVGMRGPMGRGDYGKYQYKFHEHNINNNYHKAKIKKMSIRFEIVGRLVTMFKQVSKTCATIFMNFSRILCQITSNKSCENLKEMQ